MKFKNIKIHNFVPLLLIITFFGVYQKTYSITAAQAAKQQQILKEIDDVLTEKIDESTYEDWVERIDQIVQKNKDIALPVIQQQVKSLQKIVTLETQPVSSDEKTIQTQVDALLKMDIKISTDQQDILKYGEWKAKVMDLISKNWDKSFRINKILEPLRNQFIKFDEAERRVLSSTPEPIPQGEGKTKTLTNDEQKLLKEINDLKYEGDNEFLKVLRGEFENKIFEKEAFKEWKEKAENVIENVEKDFDKMPKQLQRASENLSNLLGDIEKKMKQSTPQKTSEIIPPTPTLNPPSTKNNEEQAVIQKINALINQNIDDSDDLEDWISDVEKIFETHEKSTSTAIQEGLEKIRINKMPNIENVLYDYIKKKSNEKFVDSPENYYIKWKKDIQDFINDFNRLWNFAVKIQARRTGSLKLQVEQIEQKIIDEDKRRAGLTTNQPTGTGSVNLSQSENEILRSLKDTQSGIDSSTTIVLLAKVIDTLDTTIRNAETFISVQSTSAPKSLVEELTKTKNDLLKKCIDLIDLNLVYDRSPAKNLDTELQLLITQKRKADDGGAKITQQLNLVKNSVMYISKIVDYVVSNEKLDEENCKDLYKTILQIIFGSNDFGRDFNGKPTINSFYKVLNTLVTYIDEYYFKNPTTTRQDKTFVDEIRNILNLITTNQTFCLTQIIKKMDSSKLIPLSNKAHLININSSIKLNNNNFNLKVDLYMSRK